MQYGALGGMQGAVRGGMHSRALGGAVSSAEGSMEGGDGAAPPKKKKRKRCRGKRSAFPASRPEWPRMQRLYAARLITVTTEVHDMCHRSEMRLHSMKECLSQVKGAPVIA